MSASFTNILIISDIEGSSGCWSPAASSFMTDQWCRACVEMSHDVNGVVQALFNAGVEHITVKDFHGTGYNLLKEQIDLRANNISGYRHGPAPGIGNPGNAQAVMFLGMHAASGTAGFLAHTLTSRIECLEVNGKLMAEVELFAASLAPFKIKPIYFSGCPIACNQAQKAISNIIVYPIDKSLGRERFDAELWRSGLAREAIISLSNDSILLYEPDGPFDASVKMRGGEKVALKLSQRWGLSHSGSRIFICAADIHDLYLKLIRSILSNFFYSYNQDNLRTIFDKMFPENNVICQEC